MCVKKRKDLRKENSIYLMILFFLMMIELTGCKQSTPPTISTGTAPTGEYIYRKQGESFENVEPMVSVKRKPYPWEEECNTSFPKITKDFFRCKGSSLNPVRIIQKGKETIRYYDCGGRQKHSLILRDDKEFIYPILIDLLNYVQLNTGKRVVITCGHCCPDHYSYLNESGLNPSSKHLIGAEVDFYVQGMEQEPEKIVDLIIRYYQEQSKYKGMKDYVDFKRYTKEDTNVSVPPWYNEEIFIKLMKKGEGRDFDNRHPYPYVCIQVRYDWDLKEKVIYSWDKAFRNFHRW